MSTKRIKCTLGTLGKAIDALESYQKKLKEKQRQMLEIAADSASADALNRFDTAQYDGDFSISVYKEMENAKTAFVVAEGDEVAFIEFGTGARYPDIHPNATEPWMEHGSWSLGEYGKGHWSDPQGWFYDQGDGTYKHTYGNPANMCLYYTAREIEKRIPDIAKEVFG